MKVAFFFWFPEWPLERQTPARALRWGETQFVFNPEGGAFDAAVVYDGMLRGAAIECPPERVLFVSAEPPAIKTYKPGFLAQFATVLTCHPKIEHAGKRYGQQGLPWHLGVAKSGRGGTAALDYDAFRTAPPGPKPKLLSVISSSATVTFGHRQRHVFVARLRAHFGDRLDVFGRGVRDMEDKAEAIVPYRYHIALENSRCGHYWTEKLADAYLGRAFPFYWGCPDVADYFAPESFVPIDIYDPEGAIAAIEAAIAADRFATAAGAIEQARDRVLDEYNLFDMLSRFWTGPAQPRAQVALRPESDFREPLPVRLWHKARRIVPRRWRPVDVPY